MPAGPPPAGILASRPGPPVSSPPVALARVRFRVDPAQVRRALNAPDGPVARDTARRCVAVMNEAKRRCPVDEGTLRASITFDVQVGEAGIVGRVGTPHPYGYFVHEGTGIYGPRAAPIVPVRAQVLRWPVRATSSSRPSSVPGRGRVTSKSLKPTGYAFARSVRGVPPRRFLTEALPAAVR
jgi:hypothetical protein